ncbi:hypothetical protein D3C87_1350910 [compost metagenome]
MRRNAAIDIGKNRIDSALANGRAFEIHTAHAGLGGEGHESGVQFLHVAGTDAVFFLGENDDGTAFRRFVGKRCKLRRIGQFLFGNTGDGAEFGCLAVAERYRAGLVEQQRVDVAGGFHRAAGHGKHVETHQPVHAGNADRRQESADGRRDERHKQRHQHDDRDGATGIGRKARNGRGGQNEDERHARKQNVERDFVRRLLALGAFNERNHPVEEGGAGSSGDANPYPVRQHLRTTGDGRAIAAGFADNRGGFARYCRFID